MPEQKKKRVKIYIYIYIYRNLCALIRINLALDMKSVRLQVRWLFFLSFFFLRFRSNKLPIEQKFKISDMAANSDFHTLANMQFSNPSSFY